MWSAKRKPPFSPEAVVEEFASVIKSYRCSKVYGDRYGGEWPREQFQKRGIFYEPAEKPKSGFIGTCFRSSTAALSNYLNMLG